MAVGAGGAVSAKGVNVGARRHFECRWFLTIALALWVLSLSAHTAVAYVDKRTYGSVNETTCGRVVSSESQSLVDVGTRILQGIIYVDASAPADPSPADASLSDPDEDGTADHPFDSVFEAMAVASDGDVILVAPGSYSAAGSSNNRLEFAGRNIQLRSHFEEDLSLIEETVLDATIVFDGTEDSDCELAGFKIQGTAFEGISGNGTAATLRYCIIEGNETCDGSVLTDFFGAMSHCLIVDNTSTFDCGSRPAVANFSGTMTNCTIANNATGISVYSAEIVNCIFYHNDIQTISVQNQGSLVMSYCNVLGGEDSVSVHETATAELVSIMALNPRFAGLGVWRNKRLTSGDYHLKSQGLRWDPDATTDSHWVCDTVTSPCIDGGDPSTDLGAERLRLPCGADVQSQVNWRINLGFYGGTEQASLPYVVPATDLTALASSAVDEETGAEKTCDGSGLNEADQHSTMVTDMWLTDGREARPWIMYDFGRTCVLYEMWVWNQNLLFEDYLGLGLKDVAIGYSEDGTTWTTLGEVELAQGTGAADYTANTTVTLSGISARYVRLFGESTWGTVGSAGLSEVRFFADATPDAESGWPYILVLDSFETYDSGSNIIYNTWLDGWVNGTGAVAGYFTEPFVEVDIVNSGLQSMPLLYENMGWPFYSEVYRELETELQNWHVGDAEALTLYFHGSTEGDPDVETDGLYLAVEDDRGAVAVVHHPDPEALLSNDWRQWRIPFEEFSSLDLSHVARLFLGVGDRNDPQPGGNGVVYFDDISLSAGTSQTIDAYPIRNIIATSNALSEDDQVPENTVNGSGLNADDTHSTRSDAMWLADLEEVDGGAVYIQFAFDAMYELREMWVWNYNAMFELMLGFGVKEFRIEYSENGTQWIILREVELAQASATDDYGVGTIVDFGDVAARYVRLTILSGWGIFEKFGLSEVRFLAGRMLSEPDTSYALVLDSFEAYGDDTKALCQIWTDGWSNRTGAQVGYRSSPFVEQDTVYSGLQAMPFLYDNTCWPYYSETCRDLEVELQDWSGSSAEALTLYFHSSAEEGKDIGADVLYVGVEDGRGRVAVVPHPDPETLVVGAWQEWTIGFDEFADVDLSDVERLFLGMGDREDPEPGGRDVIYIDNIGLSLGVSETAGGQ